jgi:hypothetical protein
MGLRRRDKSQKERDRDIIDEDKKVGGKGLEH